MASRAPNVPTPYPELGGRQEDPKRIRQKTIGSATCPTAPTGSRPYTEAPEWSALGREWRKSAQPLRQFLPAVRGNTYRDLSPTDLSSKGRQK